MKTYYDVIVIGGGPIGSYTARQLADKGFYVCVMEKKEQIGNGVVCTGVISQKTFKHHDLPFESIQTTINIFKFISPKGQELTYSHPNLHVYVVNRDIFDYKVSECAQKSGVEYKLGHQVKSIEESGKYYKIFCNGKVWLTKAVVVATGVNYQLQKKLGFGSPSKFFVGSQIELPLSMDDLSIRIYLDQQYIPGSFAWVVPLNKSRARIGMILEKNGKMYLKRFLKDRLGIDNIIDEQIKIKRVAYGTIKKSVCGKIIVVGEAAGQVKTTTGGGIFMGLLCSEILVDKLTLALKKGKSLDDYEISWRSALSPELELGKKLRQSAGHFNNRAIESLFSFIKNHQFWVNLLIPRIDFDFHSDLFYYCLRSFSFLLKRLDSH